MGKKAPALHFNEVQPARGLEQSAGRNQIQGAGDIPLQSEKKAGRAGSNETIPRLVSPASFPSRFHQSSKLPDQYC
jgi:hypothetical protein